MYNTELFSLMLGKLTMLLFGTLLYMLVISFTCLLFGITI